MLTTDNVGAVPIAAHWELLAPEKICDSPSAAERSHAETRSGACRVALHRQRAEAA
jgi:hypothetical protein